MSNPSAPITLAIDPGFDRVGWAVGEAQHARYRVIAYGCIETDRTQSLGQRYLEIDTHIQKIIAEYKPEQLAIEELFFSKNQTTALKVSEARGVIISCAARAGLNLFEYNPQQVKLAVTGYGRADKQAMEKMIRMQLKLAKEKLLDDTIDALGVLVTHGAVRRG